MTAAAIIILLITFKTLHQLLNIFLGSGHANVRKLQPQVLLRKMGIQRAYTPMKTTCTDLNAIRDNFWLGYLLQMNVEVRGTTKIAKKHLKNMRTENWNRPLNSSCHYVGRIDPSG
jgi:hypothetical protein